MRNLPKCMALAVCSMIALFQPLSFAIQNDGTPGAKTLFYDPGTGAVLRSSEKKKNPRTGITKVKPAQPGRAKYTGIHCWIELDGVGRVTPDHVFRTGDRIRLHIRANVDGYLVLWSLDSSGVGKQLFPAPNQAEGDNHIEADNEYVTPGKIKFSPPVEDERLLVFFSRSKVDIPAPVSNRTNDNVIATARSFAGSKALLFEKEDTEPTEVGIYVVNKNGGLVVKELRLKHR